MLRRPELNIAVREGAASSPRASHFPRSRGRDRAHRDGGAHAARQVRRGLVRAAGHSQPCGAGLATEVLSPFMRSMASSLSALLRDEAGGISTAYALMIPLLFGAAGVGLDYSRAASERSKLQAVADSAAIAAARELQMAKADPDKIAAVAKSYVTAQIADVAIGTKVDTQALTVRVDLQKDIEPTIVKVIWSGKIHLTASATAGMSGGLPLCLIGLDPKAAGTIKLEQKALLTAPGDRKSVV